jgi:hypothetical protein
LNNDERGNYVGAACSRRMQQREAEPTPFLSLGSGSKYGCFVKAAYRKASSTQGWGLAPVGESQVRRFCHAEEDRSTVFLSLKAENYVSQFLSCQGGSKYGLCQKSGSPMYGNFVKEARTDVRRFCHSAARVFWGIGLDEASRRGERFRILSTVERSLFSSIRS